MKHRVQLFLNSLTWQFTEHELDDILFVLNTESEETLKQYQKMTKRILLTIMKHREENFQPEFKVT